VSRELLSRMAEGVPAKSLALGLDAEGGFTLSFS
jgi:hypothetical protein